MIPIFILLFRQKAIWEVIFKFVVNVLILTV